MTAKTPNDDFFSPREMEVLRLIARGHPNKGIAQRMAPKDNGDPVAVETVNTYVRRILAKLNVPSRAAAIAAAQGRGYVFHACDEVCRAGFDAIEQGTTQLGEKADDETSR